MQFPTMPRLLLGLVLSVSSVSAISNLPVAAAAAQDPSIPRQAKLLSQYSAIEVEIASPPGRAGYMSNYPEALRAWQDRLAARFNAAAATVEEIMQVDTANSGMWRERLETLRLYGQPVSSAKQRSVYGPGEVDKKAKVLSAPAAIYTDAAGADKIRGEVRLRLVLSADGSAINIFPIKTLSHGLTEAAMTAARQIKFKPATRKGQPASQFATFVYEFRNRDATPHIPRTVF